MRKVQPSNKYSHADGIRLGLDGSQVLVENFGFHTITAIEAEMAKDVSLEDAFRKYAGLNQIEVQGMRELGLSRAEVLVENFGYHTIHAIQAEMAKDVSLEDAFTKYSGLNYIQVKGMTELGLIRAQVLVENFSYHTIQAIEYIKKRTKDLPLHEAFEMVAGKSSEDTKTVVQVYLRTTTEPPKPLNLTPEIRIPVMPGSGSGHQCAALKTMKELRRLGFEGVFDIQCDDRIGQILFDADTGIRYVNHEPIVSRQLISMIPDFKSVKSDSDGIKIVDGFGAVKISSLPSDYRNKSDLVLPEVDLAVCAADDWSCPHEEKKAKFGALVYIGLQPTDWPLGSCFITYQDGVVTRLPDAFTMRLSSNASYQLPNMDSIKLSYTEDLVVEVVDSDKVNSQLVYGLYPDMIYDVEASSDECDDLIESGYLNPVIVMQRIIDAHLTLSQTTGKPSILLLPQKIALNQEFIQEIKNYNSAIRFVNMTDIYDMNLRSYKAGQVVIAYIGAIQQPVFDYLLCQGTTLPPIIEGCNSIETCELVGKPYIHGSYKNQSLKQYEVEAIEIQELHTKACRCLEQGDPADVPFLLEYMSRCLEPGDAELKAYHRQRQAAFLQRPNACEVALDVAGIAYGKNYDKDSQSKCGARFFSSEQPQTHLNDQSHENQEPQKGQDDEEPSFCSLDKNP